MAVRQATAPESYVGDSQALGALLRIEHSLDMAIDCAQHTDASEHRGCAKCRHQDQGFHRSLPFIRSAKCSIVNGEGAAFDGTAAASVDGVAYR
jgi:hypothetical protein